MDDPSVALVSLFLLGFAAWLMISHVRSWKAYQLQDLDAEDFDFRRRQYRRRMQTSAMLGILAVALFVGRVLTEWLHSGWFAAVFWIAVILVVGWVGLLALVDAWATKHHFGRQHDRYMIERAKLQAEAHRIQSIRGNGKAGKGSHGVLGEGRKTKDEG
jgi:MFS family permease